jgi:hypothetical protein
MESIMKTKILAALLVAASATLAAPAFASGYGPAPFYSPGVGAPASQQGPSVQTVAAEAHAATQNGTSQAATTGYGSNTTGTSQSGQRREVTVSSYSPPVYVLR